MSALNGGFLAWKHRILYSMFRAAVRVGIRLRVPLDQMEMMLRMACFREAREQEELPLDEVALLFGKSLRTVSSLHRQYRTDFFAPEQEVQFRRDLAAALVRRSQTAPELRERFADRTPEELSAALDDLLRERRILRDGDRWFRNPEDHDFFDEADLHARIDGLNRQLDILAETVWGRLVEPRPRVTARSYVFAASDADFDAIIETVLAQLRVQAIAADERAPDQPGVRRAITLAATPFPEASP